MQRYDGGMTTSRTPAEAVAFHLDAMEGWLESAAANDGHGDGEMVGAYAAMAQAHAAAVHAVIVAEEAAWARRDRAIRNPNA